MAKSWTKPKDQVMRRPTVGLGRNPIRVQVANPFIGETVVETLLNVNSVLEFLSDAARNRDVTAPEISCGSGFANICDALQNALAHQVIALQEPTLEATNG